MLRSGDDFEPVHARGPLTDGWLVDHNREGEEPLRFEVRRALHGLDICLDIDLQSGVRWFRLIKEVPADRLTSGYFRLGLRYGADSAAVGPDTPVGAIGLLKRDKAGYFRALGWVEDALVVGATEAGIDGILRIGTDLAEGEAVFLTLELRRLVHVKVFEFSLSVSDHDQYLAHSLKPAEGAAVARPHAAPYRQAKLPVSAQLVSLNDEMDGMLRKNPIDWFSGMLRVALQLEDYTTAEALAANALAMFDRSDRQFAKLVPQICSVFVALGDVRRLSDLALGFAALDPSAHRSDALGVILKALGEDPGDPFEINRKIAGGADAVGFATLLNVIGQSRNRNLMLANYYRQEDSARQQEFLDRYLAGFAMSHDVELGTGGDNVLKGAAFRPREVARTAAAPGKIDIARRPLISVIMAAYNCETTVEYAVNSILGQSYGNIELLIADDCSTDGTPEILRRFADRPNVRLFRSTRNQGPYNIRNAMIAQAGGEYITFHDSDDLAFPDRVEAQYAAMSERGTYASVGRWLRIMPNGHFVLFTDGEFLRMCVNSIMFHRRLFDLFGPYRSVMFGADSEFYENLRGQLGPDKVTIVDRPCVLGLWSGASLTRTAGIEANEKGYRAPKRRIYSALAGRQRVLGKALLPDAVIEAALREAEVFRDPQPLEEIVKGNAA
ncbi:MAG: glycosyltransferase family 2 protein [Rhodobacteraceae bacterium]|jgi:hypothetical protein|nr:glycosyltransferase family 2 protein [Paracoccaceae bacterium]